MMAFFFFLFCFFFSFFRGCVCFCLGASFFFSVCCWGGVVFLLVLWFFCFGFVFRLDVGWCGLVMLLLRWCLLSFFGLLVFLVLCILVRVGLFVIMGVVLVCLRFFFVVLFSGFSLGLAGYYRLVYGFVRVFGTSQIFTATER